MYQRTSVDSQKSISVSLQNTHKHKNFLVLAVICSWRPVEMNRKFNKGHKLEYID